MNNLFVGRNKLNSNPNTAKGSFTLIGNEKFYQIEEYDTMLPFFISLASDSNHWMYISSTGGLTAGRISPDNALFPYYTDDKIHESAESTGSKTILHVNRDGHTYLWEPFSQRYSGIYTIKRRILKSTTGNKLIFEEHNLDLGLTFCYGWMNSDQFGWIKKSWLTNNTSQSIEVRLVDGLQNILPYGVNQFTQSKFSTLVDAYKKSELIASVSLALFRMESLMADRAEPSEALRTTTVWTYGLENNLYLLSSNQLNAFRHGSAITNETESKGVRGAFFIANSTTLAASETKTWYFVAEVNQDAVRVNNLIHLLEISNNVDTLLEESIDRGTQALQSMIAQADGIQHTADEHIAARHFANVLFNVMRGGIYSNGYSIGKADFGKHIKHFNANTYNAHADFLNSLPNTIGYGELSQRVQAQGDAQLYRLFLEYLPLTFSRRHGDPSRPWNAFNINVKDQHGNRILYYQGNWRDIFQNWEALSLSYPGFIDSIIAKFLNATTADGYNPYRITSEGIDWEVIEPDNPWSNIGYWGDHQIIYLLRLLELSNSLFPEQISGWLTRSIFAYANVPYRIKGYNQIVANPKSTVTFDTALHKSIEKRVATIGADAKLVQSADGNVKMVNLTEKLLNTLLAKLSNFIPEAGIWMNTLRPEWNDANNALVGTGASMVTLYYMQRFVRFTTELLGASTAGRFEVSEEIATFLNAVHKSLMEYSHLLSSRFDDQSRRNVTNQLGYAGESYRNAVYQGFSGNRVSVTKPELLAFLELTRAYIAQSVRENKRPDGMYHAYNLVSFSDDAIAIRHLSEMLEGQVAVLSSGALGAAEAVELLESLRRSAMYRADQQSYTLYPNKQLPTFLEKNNIPAELLAKSTLLKELVSEGNTQIVSRDLRGDVHFCADFINAEHLALALDKLNESKPVAAAERKQIMDIYEQLFDHQSFTGRSGTFYKYEGLGSIYWHMVSKLLLAIGENIQQAVANNEDEATISALRRHYNEVKRGIGAHKSPTEYGSFPFDAYSHTPMMAGVQQPGMTGQVKEDIISRFHELGITVNGGCISINTWMLNADEFDAASVPSITITYCSIPFSYVIDGKTGVTIHYSDGTTSTQNGYTLPQDVSQQIFMRSGSIAMIEIHTTNS